MVCVRLSEKSPTTAIAREELIEKGLQLLVDRHAVGLAQLETTSWTGVHLSFERALQAAFADIMVALCGDWLPHQFLAANAQTQLFKL